MQKVYSIPAIIPNLSIDVPDGNGNHAKDWSTILQFSAWASPGLI